ncbi:MAG TPA: VacB/RNase II family 3'-5' exoribonuclease [bacterium]|nr:VacB/RNase II family 3'-5' exoribonuclease [bacterium]
MRISGEYRGSLRAELAGIAASDTTISIPKTSSLGARIGDIAVVEIETTVTKSNTGRVVEILGNAATAGIEERIIIESAGIPRTFPAEVLSEASTFQTPTSSDFAGRHDYRDEWVYTIDGADARDLDDAIHVRRLPDGDYELGVHIADVSHYVREGSMLDREASARSTSVYLGMEVIPMLPERLSNDLCSLHPGTPKLTQSVIVRVSADGQIRLLELGESVIESRKRFTYLEVQAIIDGDADESAYPDELRESIRTAYELYTLIAIKRKREGKISFEFSETAIDYENPLTIRSIRPKHRVDAHKLIEEFMITANEAVAKHFATKRLPNLSRIHECPEPDRLSRLAEILSAYGIETSGEALARHEEMERIVEQLSSPEKEPLLKYVLTSLKKAEYSPQNLGHHGLGLKHYSHFTSPIRRYPDLITHRLVKAWSRHELSHAVIDRYAKNLPEIATRTSALERRAERAEYDVRDTRLARYAAGKIGEIYGAVITGTTEFGAFARTDEGLEGFCFWREIPVRTRWHEPSLSLVDAQGYAYLRIGDRVQVRLSAADPATRRIDFALVDRETREEIRIDLTHRMNIGRGVKKTKKIPVPPTSPSSHAPAKKPRRPRRRGGKGRKKTSNN